MNYAKVSINKRSSGRAQIRGGFWVKTLCKDCNNEIASPYAKEYVKFVRDLVASPIIYEPSGKGRLIVIRQNVLFLAKEIATMILAIEPLSFAQHHHKLRSFVLDRQITIDPDFKVLAFLVPDVEQAGTITRYHGRVDTYAPGYGFMGGEISGYPFGFVYTNRIEKGYDLEKFTDITHWFSANQSGVESTCLRLFTRLTGVDSIQAGLSRKRAHPQIDYIR